MFGGDVELVINILSIVIIKDIKKEEAFRAKLKYSIKLYNWLFVFETEQFCYVAEVGETR